MLSRLPRRLLNVFGTYNLRSLSRVLNLVTHVSEFSLAGENAGIYLFFYFSAKDQVSVLRPHILPYIFLIFKKG